jgi:hypothetical protein
MFIESFVWKRYTFIWQVFFTTRQYIPSRGFETKVCHSSASEISGLDASVTYPAVKKPATLGEKASSQPSSRNQASSLSTPDPPRPNYIH